MRSLFNFTSRDLAIDLGTANTVVYCPGPGHRHQRALRGRHGTHQWRPQSAGGRGRCQADARQDSRQYPNDPAARNGVIADIEVAEEMIKHFIRKAHGGPSRFSRGPEVVICIPSGATSVERRAIRDAVTNAGADRVSLIEEPMAAAIRRGPPVRRTDRFDGRRYRRGDNRSRCDLAPGTGVCRSSRVGGDKMDEAIISYVRRNFNLLIGEGTAERVKLEIGSAVRPGEGREPVDASPGRDVGRGMPAEIELAQAQVAEALSRTREPDIEVVRTALENTQPERSRPTSLTKASPDWRRIALRGFARSFRMRPDFRSGWPTNR